MSINLEEIKNIQQQFEDVKLDLIKSKDMDWQQQQTIKNILEETKEKIAGLQKWLRQWNP